jgi:hypothetical protein
MAQQKRPEPGIATDEELRTAARELADSLRDDIVREVKAERFGTVAQFSGDPWTEVITVKLTEKRQATKETVINDALTGDAPIRLRDLEEGNEDKLTFYPTNQQG